MSKERLNKKNANLKLFNYFKLSNIVVFSIEINPISTKYLLTGSYIPIFLNINRF